MTEPAKSKRVLAVRGGALGDFLLTLPAIRDLREAGHEVGLLTRPAYGRLALETGLVSGWRGLDSVEAAALFSLSAELESGWREWLRGFDAVVSWVPDPDEVFRNQVQRCGVRTFRQADWRCQGPGPAADQLRAGLSGSGLITEADGGEFQLFACTERDPSEIRNRGMKCYAFHPGSGSPRKNWGLDRWMQVIRGISGRERNLRWLVIAGEAEADRMAGIRRRMGESGLEWELLDGLPLTELAGRLRDCAAFFGHDSGVSHLAGICGVPCRLWFGPTDPAVWAPAGAHVRVLRAPEGDLERLTVEQAEGFLALHPVCANAGGGGLAG